MPDALDEITSIIDGRKLVTAAGTAERLVAATQRCKWVQITALATNTTIVAIGGPDVLATAGSEAGALLAAGATTRIPIVDAHRLWVDAKTSGQGVAFLIGVE